MDLFKVQDKVLSELEDEMGARRAGVKRKPLLSIEIMAPAEEPEGEEMAEAEPIEPREDSAEDEMGIPEDGGWEEYLKKRYKKD